MISRICQEYAVKNADFYVSPSPVARGDMCGGFVKIFCCLLTYSPP